MKRDIFSAANSRVSLFVQALLGVKAHGRVYNNFAFTLRERDKDNKAVRTVEFHLDMDLAEVWGLDLAERNCVREFESIKETKGQYRNMQLRPDRKTPELFAVSVIQGNKDNRLWIRLDPDQRRALGRRMTQTVENYHRMQDEQAFYATV